MLKIVLLLVLLATTCLSGQVYRSYNAEDSFFSNFHFSRKRKVIRTYYENGQVKSEVEVHNNRKDGLTKEYYQDGTIKALIYYKNGREDDIAMFFYPNGILKREVKYSHGKIKEVIIYGKNGEVVSKKED